MVSTGKRKPPASLFALGNARLPGEFSLHGHTYVFLSPFKHDFFAATGLYERDGEKLLAVLKVQRTYPFFCFPMRWLGRVVARHESAIYQRLQGVRGIPQFLGRVGPTGLLHEFIPGADLHRGQKLSREFFDDLARLFTDVHGRNVAYVDANKRENILLGEDGRPWLIDFQISYQYRGGPRGRNLAARWMLNRLIRADWYHYHKHKTRLLPDACTPEDFAKAQCPGRLHRMHRWFTRPLINARRRFLARYDLRNN